MIQEYIKYISDIKGYSGHTAAAYSRDLTAFVAWAKANISNARWSIITRDDIDTWVYDMSKEGKSPATINRHLASVSGLYKYMQRNGLDVTNPCRYETRKKIQQRQPNTINEVAIKKAWENADTETSIMIRLLYVTGMRISELLAIRTNDINYRDNTIRVTGKGNKQRTVFIDSDSSTALQDYIKGRRGIIFTADERTARARIFFALKRFSNDRQLSPHAIRHTFATRLAKNGAPTTTIAAILGHNDIKTTQKYIDMAGVSTQYQYNKYFV